MPRRPLCFIVVVWGREFREYFLRYCLASLMVPDNIPALCRPGDRFLIATTPEDQAAMRESAIFRAAENFLAFEFFDLDKPAPDVPAVLHSNRHLVKLLERAHHLQAYGVMLSPDHIFSNELGGKLAEEIAARTELLMLPTVRLAGESLFENFHDPRQKEADSALDVSAKILLHAAVKSLHPEIMAAEWQRNYFGDYVNSAWWSAGEDKGILLHTFSFIPLLIDYASIARHDTSDALVSNTDGPYLAHNFPPDTRVKVIEEGGTVMTVSWAPFRRHNEGILRPKWLLQVPGLGEILRGALLRHRAHYYVVECDDWIKRRLFARPMLWRIGGNDAAWSALEEHAAHVLDRCLFDLIELPDRGAPANRTRRAIMRALVLVVTAYVPFYQRQRYMTLLLGNYLAVITAAASGDESARGRILSRVRRLVGLA